LTAPERAMLRRLCVFAGRFTLEDAESVCGGGDAAPGSALELMASLVDKPLVTKEDAGDTACYRLHETTREYAARKLDEAGESEALVSRFNDYYFGRCASWGHEARFRLLEWLPWMDLEIDNIRAVLRRCLDQSDSARGLDL